MVFASFAQTGETKAPILISDCNELKEGEDDGIAASEDGIPDWPDDLEPTVSNDVVVSLQ